MEYLENEYVFKKKYFYIILKKFLIHKSKKKYLEHFQNIC